MAPIRPFLALKETNGHNSPFSTHYIAEAIREKYQTLVKQDETSWREMISTGQLIALFIEGKQILDWNPYSGQYTPRKLKRTDPSKVKAVNYMQYYCTMWQEKWGDSTPDIILGANSNKDQDIARTRKANIVVDHLEYEMYDVWYNYHEGLMAQIFGWYGNRVRTCNKSGKMVQRPIIEEKEVSIGEGYGKCYDCEFSGGTFNSLQISATDAMPMCPECGSTAVNYEPPVTQLIPSVTGQESFRLPKIIAEQLPFPACRWDIRFRAEDSSWFLYEQQVNPNAVRRALGNVRLPEGETPNTLGMDVIASLAAMGAPMGGRSATGGVNKQESGDKCTVSELFLGPDDLYDITVRGDEQTVDGQMLPVGARLNEVFPNGACFVGLNGFNLITGIHAEHHSESVTSGVYHMKPLSGTGRGVGDAVEGQKRSNRFDSQIVRFMQTRATPATLHMEGAIPADKMHLLGQPDVNIPVSMQNFPEVRDIRQLVSPMQGESVGGDIMQYTYQHLQNFMQLAYHTTIAGGVTAAGVKNDTATYADIADQASRGLFSPALNIKADVYLKTAKKAFDLWCKVNPVKQFVPFKSAGKSGSRGIEVSGEDVQGEYRWETVPGTELPRNRLIKRKETAAFFSIFGGAIPYFQAKEQFPQETAELEREFDMDFADPNYDEIGEGCRARFEMAKGLLDQSSQMREEAMQMYGVELPPADPMMIMPEVQPSMLVTESNLPEKAKWFSNMLDTDEGVIMPDEERNLVSAFVQAFMMLAQGQQIAVQTGANEAEVAANAPIQANQDEHMVKQAQVDAETQAQGQSPEMSPEDQQAMEMQKGDIEHQRAIELQDNQAKNDIAREKSKPKPSKKG